MALRVGWYVWETIHPCRVESCRKAVSTVEDDFVTDPVIIDNLNGMLKLVDNVCYHNLRLVIFEARGAEMSWWNKKVLFQ